MHTILKQQLLSLGIPKDEYEHHIFLCPLQLHKNSKLHLKLSSLMNKYLEETRGNRGPKQLEIFKYHWQWVLLGLSRAIITNSWLLVSLDTKTYVKDIWLQRYDIKYSSIKPIVDYLESRGLVTVLKGKKYKDKPSRTRLFPTAALSNLIWDYVLDQEQPIEGPYLTLNEGDDAWSETIFNLDESHPDLGDMIAINEFMKPHRWACKAPIRLVYKHTPFQGGRLITPFQNLPDRRTRVRINTLIDDQTICEVDFNANHLRIVLAQISKEYAGDTPYEDICYEAGVVSRGMVKRFLTVAMGADNETSGRKALYQEGFDNVFIDRIYQGTQKRYPKLELFSGWGIFAQNFEGQILKDVLLEGIKEDIVCLPVHDAVAVQQQHQNWAKDVMLGTWQEHMDGVRTKVKVDSP